MKTLKYLRYAVICALTVLCEMIFGSYIEICGAVPMFGFCFCITASAFERDISCAVGVAAVTGALCDVLYGHGFGTYTVSFALVALAVFYVRDKVFSSGILMLLTSVFVMSLAVNVVYYVFHITEIGTDFGSMAVSVILPSCIYNTVIALIFYPFVKRSFGKRG